jgi:Surface antigen.
MLGFFDAGKTWADAREFNPFQVYRSAGVGMRIFLPMFGLLGLDYGWRLDDIPSAPNMAPQSIPLQHRHEHGRVVTPPLFSS